MTPQPPPKRVRLTQAQRRAQTRSAILEAAATVFSQRGLHASSVDDVAEAAGVSKGAVYYSFASKDDLFLALLEQRLDEWVAEMRGTPRGQELGGQAAHATAGYFANLARDPGWTLLLLEFLAESARHDVNRRVMRERFFVALADSVAEVLEERAESAGLELAVPADVLAAGINALACGLAVAQPFEPDHAPDHVMTTILGLVLDGLTARAEGRP